MSLLKGIDVQALKMDVHVVGVYFTGPDSDVVPPEGFVQYFDKSPIDKIRKRIEEARERILVWSVALSLIDDFVDLAAKRKNQNEKFDLRVVLAEPHSRLSHLHPNDAERIKRAEKVLRDVTELGVQTRGLIEAFKLLDFSFYQTGFIIDSAVFLIPHRRLKRSNESTCEFFTVSTRKFLIEDFNDMWNSAQNWNFTPDRLGHASNEQVKLSDDYIDPFACMEESDDPWVDPRETFKASSLKLFEEYNLLHPIDKYHCLVTLKKLFGIE